MPAFSWDFFLKTLAKAVYHIYITRKGCYVEDLFKVEQVDNHATSAYVEFTSPTDFKKYQLSYSSPFEANFMAKNDWDKPVKIWINESSPQDSLIAKRLTTKPILYLVDLWAICMCLILFAIINWQ